MLTIFTMTNGRSGTWFLRDLIRLNARDCVCKHEPYFGWMNPTMFGRPIYDHARGNYEAIRKLLQRKRRGISRYRPRAYVETSHAFLKSWYDLAPEFFPELKLIHLIRHPLKTARSEANREAKAHQVRFPFRYYEGDDGRRYYRWSLTGIEPIYQHFRLEQLTSFQRYVIQWIEIENRAMGLLDRHGLHDACFTLHSPRDLNDPDRVVELLRFLGLECKADRVTIAGFKNPTPDFPTVITEAEERQFQGVIAALPRSYLSIFRGAPYSEAEWVGQLCAVHEGQGDPAQPLAPVPPSLQSESGASQSTRAEGR